MSRGKLIKKARKDAGLTQHGLAEKANMSRSYLADLENDRYNPSVTTLEKIAEVLNVSLDHLTGESAKNLIDTQLNKLNMTLTNLATTAGVPIGFLTNLENIMPDQGDYETISRIATAINLNPGVLRAALARQEAPVYNDTPDPALVVREFDAIPYATNEILYISLNRSDDPLSDLPPEAIHEINNFIDFVRSKYKVDK